MQDTLVRVFVVALGLLLCPRDDPGVEEEWINIITVDMHKHEERLLKEEVKLHQETSPVSEKTTHADNKGLQNMMKSVPVRQNQLGQHATDNRVSDDVIVTKQYSDLDPSQLQKSTSEPEIALKTSQTDPFQDSIEPQEQQGKPEVEKSRSVQTKMSENDSSERATADWGEDYVRYVWNMFSVISLIHFFMKYLKRISPGKQCDARTFPVTCIASDMPLPDSDTLQSFHCKCVHASPENKWREREFLEGFINDMVEAMRTLCDGNGGMIIEDHQMISARDIIVPFSPAEPYSFQCVLRDNQVSDLLPDLQVCGQIKLVENQIIQNGCQCQSSHKDEDVVCLLQCENEKAQTKMTEVRDGHLCLKNTPFLSKSQVTRWFQSKIKESWAQISHKYDFELSIRYIDAPGALLVRFRSGKRISFTMNPAVKFNTQSHFYITPYSPDNLDTFWMLSLTAYEDQLLERLSKSLPQNPCHMQTLEIACFLHKRQTALSGSSVLKSFHFKTALMHLLLTREASLWIPDRVACRVRDLLVFMERSLEKKLLQHVLIGNPLAQKIILLPEEFTQAKPVNLFHPLVVDRCTYRNAIKHFQEMVRNAHMLIQDYVGVHYPSNEEVSS
ncbi:inositol 1,4,5-trisphosphate receptor-interacting protein [Solea solea]|uniref:inositol 1,4,5-trisphosphate receptor-interacting protein n=1 Tax=Solea solea TaxID=90069 RepID=UPI00272AAE44|nr:inositol 1,4,5-trisphosphate receptor-interacting protein [Solea solea]XP_058495577.1 inositol 1,4,5-trisphosphate receptor-interacting protein [Solea solea]XP_058495578.1 inositol 1,4,5-trisphosphate receptor-interacting protein [Solea solea]